MKRLVIAVAIAVTSLIGATLTARAGRGLDYPSRVWVGSDSDGWKWGDGVMANARASADENQRIGCNVRGEFYRPDGYYSSTLAYVSYVYCFAVNEAGEVAVCYHQTTSETTQQGGLAFDPIAIAAASIDERSHIWFAAEPSGQCRSVAVVEDSIELPGAQ